ncbi:HAD family hydrolase [Brachybacterium sp. ACRRE]|uniref:HAD family hydrolase n=1 Tax=Brachybacterium sp. ACRRE TaxID=2918184 RepID=UPI001EF2696D|nr:HAD family hydrolase [Brachybacterium sp. ACRRE]MCG7308537.1 haloacid dehalogenase [Brachybacterium sp. ACRRE]
MLDALADYRALLAEDGVWVAVSDLDGVLRVFDTTPWAALDEQLGLPQGSAFRAVLRDPLLEDVTRGRATHEAWRESILSTLRDQGVPAARARRAIGTWADDRGRLDTDVLDLLQDAQREGIEVFVLTNGTDRVREELEELCAHEDPAVPTPRRFGDLLDPHGEWVLNTAELGEAKPDPAAFALAHARIERVLGRAVPRCSVAFLDDSASHTEGAEEFGWRAVRLRRA